MNGWNGMGEERREDGTENGEDGNGDVVRRGDDDGTRREHGDEMGMVWGGDGKGGWEGT